MTGKLRSNFVRLLGGMCLLLFLWAGPVFGAAGPRVMILNSDMGINGPYLTVQTSFVNALDFLPPENIRAVDLGKKWLEEDVLVRDIAEFEADYLYCIGAEAYRLGRGFAGTAKLIFSSTINWRRLTPGSGIYGIANEVSAAEQLKVFSEIMPGLRRLGILYSRRFNGEFIEAAGREAAARGLTLVPMEVRAQGETAALVLDNFVNLDALWLIADPLAVSGFQDIKVIFAESRELKKAVFAWRGSFINRGALITIEADTAGIGRQAAGILKSLVHGRRPEVRVGVPLTKRVVVNLKMAAELGIKFDRRALNPAYEVIK